MLNLLVAALLLVMPTPGPRSACTVTGSVTDDDGQRARSACALARERFRELFDVEPPALEIVLRDQPGYRVSDVGSGARVFWPTSSALRAAATGSSPGRPPAEQWREVLPHEAMHALTAAHFFEAGSDVGAAYGTPLPDWFEEGVAIWAESHVYRSVRMAQARRLAPHFQVLTDILEGAHPAAADPSLLAARDGGALPEHDAALWAFYPQSFAVLAFVYDAGGANAVRALAGRLLAGRRDGAVLAGLPGLPEHPRAVIAAWEDWLPVSGTSRAVAERRASAR